jgi:tripartite-type tricarboxylate transporter receptor subunit TctC
MKVLMIAIMAMLASESSAVAQVYPSRPITIIVPFPPGGPTDVLPRILAEHMKGSLGQPIIIENVTGAGGTLGVGRVARAAPDGYTVGIGNWGTHVANGAIYSLAYDLVKDFEPVALLPNNPQVIVASSAVPVKDLSELVAWLKTNPNKANFGISGPGSAAHFSALHFQTITRTQFRFVPYRGGSAAMQDLLAGQIDIMINQASLFLPYVRDDRIRIFAIMAKSRLPQAPDIPTVDEVGLPGFYVSVWNGFWVPKGTPKSVISKLNSAVVAALADPTVRGRLIALGQEIPPRDQQTPESLAVVQSAEIAKWWPIIKSAEIKPQ